MGPLSWMVIEGDDGESPGLTLDSIRSKVSSTSIIPGLSFGSVIQQALINFTKSLSELSAILPGSSPPADCHQDLETLFFGIGFILA